MKYRNYFPRLNLQLFADGGAGDGGGTGAEGASGVAEGASLPSTSRQAKNPLANVVYGKQAQESAHNADAQTAGNADVVANDRNAEFEELIKGKYKDLYDARVSDIVQKRLKNSKDTVDRYNALSPTVEMLGKKYGLRPDADGNYDIAALNKAIEDDDTYYEDEAIEKGITVEQLKEIRKMERENAALKEQMRKQQVQENADRIYSQWMTQAQEVAKVYPSFNLNAELQNQKFVDLLRSNIDVRTAYEVVHKDEIIPAAMQFTAQQTEQKITNKIRSAGARPAEGGASSQSATIYKSDVSQLSREDRDEICRRVARGERIVL